MFLLWSNLDQKHEVDYVRFVLCCRVCRIQLRLPAGGTTVVEMDRTDTLSALRETVAQVRFTTSHFYFLDVTLRTLLIIHFLRLELVTSATVLRMVGRGKVKTASLCLGSTVGRP